MPDDILSILQAEDVTFVPCPYFQQCSCAGYGCDNKNNEKTCGMFNSAQKEASKHEC